MRLVISLLFLVILSSCGGSRYTAPETVEAEDGWLAFVNAEDRDFDACRAINPDQSGPVSTLAKFLSSRVRRDLLWKETFLNINNPSERMEGQLRKWDTFYLTGFRLIKMKFNSEDWAYIIAKLKFTFKGNELTREATFEVKRQREKWFITELPD